MKGSGGRGGEGGGGGRGGGGEGGRGCGDNITASMINGDQEMPSESSLWKRLIKNIIYCCLSVCV